MSDGLTLSPMGLPSAPLLAELHASAFADPAISGPAWTADAFSSLLALPGTQALVAQWAGGEPVGFILWRCAADEAEILTLAVLPTARNQGVGRTLVEGCVRLAAAAGAAQLFLEVSDANQPAQSLYARTSFRETGRRRGYYRQGFGGQTTSVDALVLCRVIEHTI